MLDDAIYSVNNSKYDVEKYKQKKKEQLSQAYKIIDETIEEIKVNPTRLKDYLKEQSKFYMYTPRNAMLILKQMPEATLVKEWSKWKEADVTFKSNYPKKILILDPKEFKAEGITRTSIYAKEVIDISETNLRPQTKSVDKKLVLQALVKISGLSFKITDSIEDNKVCKLNLEDMVLYVDNTKADDDLIIQSVASEVAKIIMVDQEQDLDEDKANCVSYMMCLKYGIEPQIDVSENLVNKYKDMESIDVIEDLTSMKNILSEMNSGIVQYLEENVKTNNVKEQER